MGDRGFRQSGFRCGFGIENGRRKVRHESGDSERRAASSSPSSFLRGPVQELETPHNSGESPGMKPRLGL